MSTIMESGENYLEAILMLGEEKDGVHAIDICEKLNITKPSVSVMLKKLREDGYITIDGENHLHLTSEGLKIANKIYERHKILTDILVRLGVNEQIAEDDACKLEHDMTDASWNAIKKYYEEKIGNQN